MEFFRYLVDPLRERGAGHVRVFGGGGGVIVPSEIEELQALRRRPHLLARGRRPPGPRRAWSTRSIAECDVDPLSVGPPTRSTRSHRRPSRLARVITALELGAVDEATVRRVAGAAAARAGAGARHHRHRRLGQVVAHRRAGAPVPRSTRRTSCGIAVIAVDPTRRRSGGALLGDRIRMNAIDGADGVLPLAGHPLGRARGARVPRRRRRGLPGRRLRPRHRRDPGHRPGRRRHRRPRRHLRST